MTRSSIRVARVVWVYYAAQISFMGAEFAQVQARRHGEGIHPSKDAMPANAARAG